MRTSSRTRDRARRGTTVPVVLALLCALTTATAPAGTGPRASGGPPGLAAPEPGEVAGLRVSGEVPRTAELGMRSPEALAVDHRGHLIIADTGNHRVLTVARSGELVDEFGGFGWDEDRLDTPSDVCVYQGFYTYVLDEGNRRVARYDVEGDYLDLVVAEDEAGSPLAIDVTTTGGLLLVDPDSQSVVSYSQFDEALAPVGRFGLDEGGLLDPLDVAAGPSQEIAVADRGRSSVEVFDEFGTRLHSVTAPDTLLPLDVAFDDRGNILVADGRHNRILAFPREGGAATAVLDGGAGFRCTALAPGAAGELFAMDGESGRVRLIELIYAGDTPSR